MRECISIIIPIYNAEIFLPRCLDSIIAQTYTNWEAVLVDDGSPDNCGVICDEYARKDRRFKVIHQENGGVSIARQRLEQIKSLGYHPLLAHPERYMYMDESEYRQLHQNGVKFQLNLASLAGGYGSVVKKPYGCCKTTTTPSAAATSTARTSLN